MKTWIWKYEDKWASISIWLIPLFTWLYGTKESPLHYTLSMIGNRFDARLEFKPGVYLAQRYCRSTCFIYSGLVDSLMPKHGGC